MPAFLRKATRLMAAAIVLSVPAYALFVLVPSLARSSPVPAVTDSVWTSGFRAVALRGRAPAEPSRAPNDAEETPGASWVFTSKGTVSGWQGPGGTQTTCSLSGPNTATHNVNVTYTATVNPHPALPGTVQFYDGATLLGSASLTSSGTASLTFKFTTTGSHSVIAFYTGNQTANYWSSWSNQIAVSVN
jgi:hypothetical protein